MSASEITKTAAELLVSPLTADLIIDYSTLQQNIIRVGAERGTVINDIKELAEAYSIAIEADAKWRYDQLKGFITGNPANGTAIDYLHRKVINQHLQEVEAQEESEFYCQTEAPLTDIILNELSKGSDSFETVFGKSHVQRMRKIDAMFDHLWTKAALPWQLKRTYDRYTNALENRMLPYRLKEFEAVMESIGTFYDMILNESDRDSLYKYFINDLYVNINVLSGLYEKLSPDHFHESYAYTLKEMVRLHDEALHEYKGSIEDDPLIDSIAMDHLNKRMKVVEYFLFDEKMPDISEQTEIDFIEIVDAMDYVFEGYLSSRINTHFPKTL